MQYSDLSRSGCPHYSALIDALPDNDDPQTEDHLEEYRRDITELRAAWIADRTIFGQTDITDASPPGAAAPTVKHYSDSHASIGWDPFVLDDMISSAQDAGVTIKPASAV